MKLTPPRRLYTTLGFFIALALPSATRADASRVESPAWHEARIRFDRGRELLDRGDAGGALAQFRRAYDVAPTPETLLMLGVLNAEMGRSVEAMRALDQVLRAPAGLNPAQVEVARQRRNEQTARVGYLRVTASVPATLQIDGLDVARAPSAEPIPVMAGTRIVAALSAGHLPARQEVVVAGAATVALHIDLAPTEVRLAHLFVRTDLPDADVLIDNQRVARTPLAQSITVVPGRRVVEVRRRGYELARQEMTLDDGATGTLSFAPREVPGDDGPAGRLVVKASEPEPELFIDGIPRGVYRAPLRLPAGRHHVRIVRAGFVPAERNIDVPADTEARLTVALPPTPELRASYVDGARSTRRWAWVSAITGAAVTAGAAALVATSLGPLSDARQTRDGVSATFLPGAACDPQGGGNHFACEADLAAANDRVASKSLVRNLGLGAVGVGVVGLALGAYLFASGDDPGRYDAIYDPNPPQDSGVRILASFGPDGSGLFLRGRF